jgi:hypothetical protein
MKLRIRRNSVRIRVTKSEVEKLRAEGTISEWTDFGGQHAKFRYELSVDAVQEPRAEFQDNCIRVFVPQGEAHQWMNSDDVGIEAKQPIGDNEFLKILVEKDFACLTARIGEDEADAFPNSSKSVTC